MSVAAIVAQKEGRNISFKKVSRASKAKIKIIDLPAFAPCNEDTLDVVEATGEELIIKYRTKARKLGRSILRRWHARLDIQEVDSIIDLSLCESALRFNPTKGASFMTFLYYHLRGNLIRAVTTAASLNTVPFSSCEAIKYVAQNESGSHSRKENSGQANAIEIAEALIGQESVMAEDMMIKKEMLELSAEARDRLDPLEREIIERLFIQEQQLLDIAHLLGYSRCHVSRVKKKALRTLQAELCEKLEMEAVALGDDDGNVVEMRRKVHRRRPRSKIYGRKNLIAKAA
jgi:RNA polymerase sigma factor (sigma-70 family)